MRERQGVAHQILVGLRANGLIYGREHFMQVMPEDTLPQP